MILATQHHHNLATVGGGGGCRNSLCFTEYFVDFRCGCSSFLGGFEGLGGWGIVRAPLVFCTYACFYVLGGVFSVAVHFGTGTAYW